MKQIISILLLLSVHMTLFSQSFKQIAKSWIVKSIEDLSSRQRPLDTSYTRYRFDDEVDISVVPAWDGVKQPWTIEKKNLTIGFDVFTIDELTDTSMVIHLDGFRKISFRAEEYLNKQGKYLDSIGVFNGKPLYQANNVITPRYRKGRSLDTEIHKAADKYQISRASIFLVTFIVTEEGKVENIKVVKSINEEFDKDCVKQLQKTSKDWRPAMFNSKPVQTEMTYQIKYLNSIAR